MPVSGLRTLCVLLAAQHCAAQLVYVGAGCFWHTQYDMAMTEKKHLGRTDAQVTASVGYSGGNSSGPGGLVCYHGGPAGSLYEDMGYAEAVSLVLDPAHAAVQFAAIMKDYFSEFKNDGKGWSRLDPQDGGSWSKGAYRPNIGIPGGMHGPLYKVITAANVNKMRLIQGGGKGDEVDEYVVYIYDSLQFPFYRGETYHQFHQRNVMGPSFYVGNDYLVTMKTAQAKAGHIPLSGCDGGSGSNRVKPATGSHAAAGKAVHMPMGGGVFSGTVTLSVDGSSTHMCITIKSTCTQGTLCGVTNYSTSAGACVGSLALGVASPIPGVVNAQDRAMNTGVESCHPSMAASLGYISGGLGYQALWAKGVLKKGRTCSPAPAKPAHATACTLKAIYSACMNSPEDPTKVSCASACAKAVLGCRGKLGALPTAFRTAVGKISTKCTVHVGSR